MDPVARAAVERMVGLLVEGEYDAAARLTDGVRFDAAQLRALLEADGRTLVRLPIGWDDDPTTVVAPVEGAVPFTLAVTVDLWTVEDGHSDLSLDLRLIEVARGLWNKRIDGIRRRPGPRRPAGPPHAHSASGPTEAPVRARPAALRDPPAPMEPGVRQVVEQIVDLLVRHDYDAVAELTGGRRFDAAELRAMVEDYGRTLVRLPPGWDSIPDDIVMTLPDRSVRTLDLVVDLETAEEGRSDLSLLVTLTELPTGGWSIEIDDLHVL